MARRLKAATAALVLLQALSLGESLELGRPAHACSVQLGMGPALETLRNRRGVSYWILQQTCSCSVRAGPSVQCTRAHSQPWAGPKP